MNKMNALVLFLLVITATSSVSYTFSNNDDQKIVMVVNDNQSPTMKTMMEDDIPLQSGRFMSRDGDLSTLLRPVNGTANCVGLNTECGAFTAWCCGELHCYNGRCAHSSDCLPPGSPCDAYTYPQCCWPYECDKSPLGHCVK